MGMSRAGMRSGDSTDGSRARASPVGASSCATEPKNAAAMGSWNAEPTDSVSSTPTAPVVPRARLRAAGSGPT